MVGFASMRVSGWGVEGLGGFLLVLPSFFFDGLVENVSGCSANMRGYLGSEVG